MSIHPFSSSPEQTSHTTRTANGYDDNNNENDDENTFSYYMNIEDDEDDELLNEEVGDCTSFREIRFESEEMKNLLKLESPPTKEKVVRPDYHAEHLFPQWILNNHEWQSTECRGKGNKISEILQISYAARSTEQTSALIHWLMSVWKTAYVMGYKRCGQMTKVFQFLIFKPGEDIIVEGEKGLTFYIIISGDATVLKDGIGQVAVLSKGHSFGELALTEGTDRRSATIRAQTRVEILQLHKADYDHFVKDIQLVEKRENLHVLRSCKLFGNWPRTKVQKLCNFCSRMIVKPGETIYHQGDEPDKIYFVIDGQVDIYKEVCVVVRNRWPTGMKSWEGMSKKRVKPFLAKSLFKDDYFGELVQDKKRTETVTAKTRCTLLTLDRLEFTHVINGGKTLEELQSGEAENLNDKQILDTMLKQLTIKGGPSTTAQLNDYVKAINVKPKIKKRSSTASDLFATTMSLSRTATESVSSNKADDENSLKTVNSTLLSPIRDQSRGPTSGRNRTSSNTESEILDSPAPDNEFNNNVNSFANGVNVVKNKSTEFTIGRSNSPSHLVKSIQAVAAANKFSHMTSARKFEHFLNRASSAVDEITAEREEPSPHKKGSFQDLMDSVSLNAKKKSEEIHLDKQQHTVEGHLKIMVDELVTAKKKSNYYDQLAEMRYSSPSIVTQQTRRINVTNGHSLKFSSNNTMKNYFKEPPKTIFSPNKNLKRVPKNPKIKINKEPHVLTSIDSVVLKSETGRSVRSYFSEDIDSYIDATSSHSSLPTSVTSLLTAKSKSRLLEGVSSYSERDIIPPEREHNLRRDFERQSSRMQEKDMMPKTTRLKAVNSGIDFDDADDDDFFA